MQVQFDLTLAKKASRLAPRPSTFNTTPVATYATVANFPGGAMAISANGNTSGTGIVWTTMTAQNAGNGAVPGTLRAFSGIPHVPPVMPPNAASVEVALGVEDQI